MKKRPSNPDLVSISWLADKHNHDRATIQRRLRGVPFVAGKKGAKLYDREVAATAIESRDDDLATLVRERARKAEIERELRQIQLDEKQKNLLPADFLTDALAIMATALRNQIASWPCTEACKQRCYLDMEKASIELITWMGGDATEQQKGLADRQKKLGEDVAAGRIPDNWFDAHLPENARRVWSQELGRYYTKKEIIQKFGSGVQLSPIDETLDEVYGNED